MPKLQVRKKTDASTDGFDTTLDYTVLMQSNVSTNHNKFYVIECQENAKGHYRIFTHYGRLGSSNVYEARETLKGSDAPITDESVVRAEYEDILKKKQKGKRNKSTGEMEAYVIVDTPSPTVGSPNIRGKSEVTKTVKVAKGLDTSNFDPKISRLIDQLVEENVHNVTTNTSIKYTASGGYQTELGPVTQAHVAKARQPLDELNKLLKKNDELDSENKEVQDLNSAFFSLIPKPFSRKISADDMILDARKLQDEYDILDQLEAGVTMGSAMGGSTAQKMNALGTDIEFLSDRDEVRRIKNYIRESKAGNHRGSNVWNYQVHGIYKIRIPEERVRFEKAARKFGNVEEVFHGSANSNLLSILMGGLIIPRASAGHVTGRMFSDGIYGANNSTKSLNYSIGFWGARSSRHDNAFLFIADFAMGKTYTAHSALPGGPPRGYDSVWARKGRSLYNDELIVYGLQQCTLKYLVEMRTR